MPEPDLYSSSHRRIDAAVLEFSPTEIFPPVGAMHRAIPVSADRAAPAGPAHPHEKPASRCGRAKSRETWTLRWREMDSNHQFRAKIDNAFYRRRAEQRREQSMLFSRQAHVHIAGDRWFESSELWLCGSSPALTF